jgi:hypothetical protein
MFTKVNKASVEAFLAKLEKFDRHWSYSDDLYVCKIGKKQEGEITSICANPLFKEIYDKWLKTQESVQTAQISMQEVRIKFTNAVNAITMKGEKLASLNENFTSAEAYLCDDKEATLYLSRRISDVAKLYCEFKWQPNAEIGVVVARMYGVAIYKNLISENIADNRIVNLQDEVKIYRNDRCLMAYILAKFW